MAFTTQERLVEQVLNELNKRNIDSNIEFGDVKLRMQQTLASLIRARYFQSKADDVAEISGAYYYTFKNISVLQDEDTDQYYFELPASTMELPGGIGIKDVAPMQDPTHGYRPVQNGFNTLYQNLASSMLQGYIGYYEEAGKIFFVNTTASNNPDKVLIKLAVPFDGIAEDAVINIPMDAQMEAVTAVVQYFLQQPQKDETNDRVDQV